MDFIARYESWLVREKRAAANTLSSYLRDVRQFEVWSRENDLVLDHVSQEDIKRYVNHLEKKGKYKATVVRSVESLNYFYKYIYI